MSGEVQKLQQWPQRADNTWQAAVVRLPVGPEGDDGLPEPLTVALCASTEGEVARPSRLVEGEVRSVDLVLEAMAALAQDRLRYRPGKVEVNDEELAERLGELLAPAGVQVEFRAQLELIEDCMKFLLESLLSEYLHGLEEERPGYLDAAGVTVDKVRAFADAVAAFVRSGVWRELGGDDLVEISRPDAPPGMRYACTLAGERSLAVALFPSEERFWALRDAEHEEEVLDAWRGLWHIGFAELEELPQADQELWQAHELPVADPEGYPLAVLLEGAADAGPRRPNAEELAFLEGLLRALANTGEDELDSGRWTVEVATALGKVEYELSLPFLLDPPGHEELYRHGIFDRRALEAAHARIGRFLDGKDFQSVEELNRALRKEFGGKKVDPGKYKPRNKLEQAQDLCYEAFDSLGRRRVALARRALHVHPDCADAYVLLAEVARTSEEAAELYAKGVEAGKRALGEDFAREYADRFWSALETRPLLRALRGLATEQLRLGRQDEGLTTLREMLRLNPNDNQGVRYWLLPRLIARGEVAEAEELLADYADDLMAVWPYCRALVSFRRHGDTPAARRLLESALSANPHVPAFLLGKRQPPGGFDSYELGSGEEAAISAGACAPAWESVPGALDWLERLSRPRKRKVTGSHLHF